MFPSCLFLKVSPVETEKGSSSWGWRGSEGVKQLVPRARRDEGKSWTPPFSLGVALSLSRAPFPGLWGSGSLYSSIWDSRAEIEARKFFAGEPGPLLGKCRWTGRGRWGEGSKGPSGAARGPCSHRGSRWDPVRGLVLSPAGWGCSPCPPLTALSPLGPQLSPGPR